MAQFYNRRGTAEQWSKKGKVALTWTQLSCHEFRDNEARWQLFASAYNLGIVLRQFALPHLFHHWSLPTLREKLIKIDAEVVRQFDQQFGRQNPLRPIGKPDRMSAGGGEVIDWESPYGRSRIRDRLVIVIIAMVLILLVVAAVNRILPFVRVHLSVRKMTRAQRSQGQSMTDLQLLAKAINQYRIDTGTYPVPIEYVLAREALTSPGLSREDLAARRQLGQPDAWGHYSVRRPGLWPISLTTPVAYYRLPIDPFCPKGDGTYGYMLWPLEKPEIFLLVGRGPDRDRDVSLYNLEFAIPEGNRQDDMSQRIFYSPLINLCYDPTNGLLSNGDILYPTPKP